LRSDMSTRPSTLDQLSRYRHTRQCG
jgi:hypothetical protein